MKKNTGKTSENLFETYLNALGKRVYFYRVADAAEIQGRTGTIGTVRPTPSDYIVTFNGTTSYNEVKSTQNKTSFPFSLIKKGQNAAAKQVLAAGGEYFVFVHSLILNQWFKIPYQHIENIKLSGKSSIKWDDLKEYKWAPNSTTI